jgi:hypothetical protein
MDNRNILSDNTARIAAFGPRSSLVIANKLSQSKPAPVMISAIIGPSAILLRMSLLCG